MRSAAALARDLPLFFGRHRCEAPTFLAFSCIHHSTLRLFTTSACEPCRVPLDQSAMADPGCEGEAARRAASPVLRPDPCRAGRVRRDSAGTCTPDALCSDARPSHPSDYQTPCPGARLAWSAKLLNYRGLLFVPCLNTERPCSGSLHKGWQQVANDCRAGFLTGAWWRTAEDVKEGPDRPRSGREAGGVTPSIWSAGARIRAGAQRLRRKRSPPCAS